MNSTGERKRLALVMFIYDMFATFKCDLKKKNI